MTPVSIRFYTLSCTKNGLVCHIGTFAIFIVFRMNFTKLSILVCFVILIKRVQFHLNRSRIAALKLIFAACLLPVFLIAKLRSELGGRVQKSKRFFHKGSYEVPALHKIF